MIINNKLLDEYRLWLMAQVSPDTVRAYSWTVQYYMSGKEAESMNSKAFFRTFQTRMMQERKNLNTTSRYVASFKKFLVFLEEVHGLQKVDTDPIKCRHGRVPDPAYLTREEIARIRALFTLTEKDLRDRALFEFLLETGCRISEVVFLNYSDLDFETGEFAVLGKGRKHRTLYFSSSKEWLLRYKRERQHVHEALFLNQYGRRLDRQWASKAISLLGKRAKIRQRVYPHLLRHTFGTYLSMAGVDVKTIQSLMGHDDVETTLKYYIGVNKDRLRMAHLELAIFLKAENTPEEVIPSTKKPSMLY